MKNSLLRYRFYKIGQIHLQQIFFKLVSQRESIEMDAHQNESTLHFFNTKSYNNLQKTKESSKRLLIQNVMPIQIKQKFDGIENTLEQQIDCTSLKQTTKPKEDFVQLLKISFGNFEKGESPMSSKQYLSVHSEQNQSDQLTKTNPASIQQSHEQISSDESEEEIRLSNNIIKDLNSLAIIKCQNPDPILEITNLDLPEKGINSEQARMRKRKQSRQQMQLQRKMERERNIEIVSDFLSGKISSIWIFIIGHGVNKSLLNEIKQVYKDYLQKDYQIPICASYQEAKSKYLSIENCVYKVVIDLQNCESAFEDNVYNKRILSIYIYNPMKEAGIMRALELKSQSKKVRGIYINLSHLLYQAKQQIQNQVKFIKTSDGDLAQYKNNHKFPSFLILSGYDSSKATSYRMNLYGAIKLSQKNQREYYLQQFIDLVQRRYQASPKEMMNLEDYKKIDHLTDINEPKARQILSFYVKENFYYSMTNSLLRVAKTPEEFKPCTLPFNETYQSIKYFYDQNTKKPVEFVAYRGARIRNSDINALKLGVYIELFGFISTSKSKKQAEKFMDNESFLIIIHVKSRKSHQKHRMYDHGYVDINQHKLAVGAFERQQQILFNALNIYRVTGIDLQSQTRTITLEYGAMFDLLQKDSRKLSQMQKSLIANYKYCTSMYDKIQDDGDVYLLAEQHDKCIEYYQYKIDGGSRNFKNYNKLAFAQLQSGSLEDAYENAIKSLELQDIKVDSDDPQLRKTVYDVNINLSNIFEEYEDYIKAEVGKDKAIQVLTEEDWFLKAKMLKERAASKFKTGDIQQCEKDLELSEIVIKDKEKSFERRRKALERSKIFRYLCCICFHQNHRVMNEDKQVQLLKIQEEEQEFKAMNDSVQQHLISIQLLRIDIAKYIGNKQKQEACRKAAQLLYDKIENKEQDDVFKRASHKMMLASLDQGVNEEMGDNLMVEAIKTIEEKDPNHQKVGEYSKALGVSRFNGIKQRFNVCSALPSGREGSEHAGLDHVQSQEDRGTFDYDLHQKSYQKCKESLHKAVQVISFNKGVENKEVLEIKNIIGNVQFDFSKLKESQNIANSILQVKSMEKHSQGAKSVLLLARISLAKGQLKRSFQQVDRSLVILTNALVKEQNSEYNKLLLTHPLFIEISLHRVKIFNRQMNHDLALKELDHIQKIAESKIDKEENNSFLASIFQQKAQILICRGQTQDFQEYLLKAISMRQRQMGKYNIPNAICYANLFKYMTYLEDIQSSIEYHFMATEIFSRFPADHPNSWIILLSNGLTFFQKKQYDTAIQQISNSLRIAERRYSPNHINLLKIKFQYGKMLNSMGRYNQALRILQSLEKDVQQNLAESNTYAKIEKQSDDEKIAIRKRLYNELRETYEKGQQMEVFDSSVTALGIKKCERYLRDFDIYS